jgi:hypothetical protein
VWDRFEARYEAEHYLGPEVWAHELIERFTGLGAAGVAAFGAVIGELPWPDLRALYGRLLAPRRRPGPGTTRRSTWTR